MTQILRKKRTTFILIDDELVITTELKHQQIKRLSKYTGSSKEEIKKFKSMLNSYLKKENIK